MESSVGGPSLSSGIHYERVVFVVIARVTGPYITAKDSS